MIIICVISVSISLSYRKDMHWLGTAFGALVFIISLPVICVVVIKVGDTEDQVAATRLVSSQDDYQDYDTEDCGDDESQQILFDGNCLPKQDLTKGCWVSAQCSSQNSVCRRPSGRHLHSLHHDLWQAYLKANRSSRFIPGRCGCNDEFVLQSESGDRLVCASRTIGSPCRSNYECGKRTRFSVCENKKCICIPAGYQYDRASDQCTPTDSRMGCENGSCPHPLFRGTYGELCFYGFTASMGLVLAFWLTFCFCGRSITSTYDPVVFTAPLTHDPTDYPSDDDEPPPDYESATMSTIPVKYPDEAILP